MMQAYFLTIALNALKWYVGTGAFARIAEAVKWLLSDTTRTGAEKSAYVVAFATGELKLIGQEFVVKALIELLLADNVKTK